VAEKALKAVLYHLVGMDPAYLTHHSLSTLLQACPANLRESHAGMDGAVATLERDNMYIKTRYPNSWAAPCIPADQYDHEMASNCYLAAELLMDIAREFS